ncbi:MAG: HAMP domain-containing histidine kinase [Deltaproteobacteria bacterium]|nr:HAMP domain-containing histidine kinase [Deltaproteobacteria bacterium]
MLNEIEYMTLLPLVFKDKMLDHVIVGKYDIDKLFIITKKTRVVWNGLQTAEVKYAMDLLKINYLCIKDSYLLYTFFTLIVLITIFYSSTGSIRSIQHIKDNLDLLIKKWNDNNIHDLQTLWDGIRKTSKQNRIPDYYLRIIRKIMESVQIATNLEKELEKNKAIAQTASQVAHDIRSPLSALTSMTSMFETLPEDQRIRIRTAVQRINDIANDLGRKKIDHEAEALEDEYSVYLLSGLIEILVTEKRMQYRARHELNIETRLGTESYGVFAKIRATEFKRVLSNVINNAVEALNEKGDVIISMERDGLNARIVCSDNGKGIPADILPKLMQKGASFGKDGHKESGSGLGLYHAREQIKGFGGNIEISSEVGKGTDVIITLPTYTEPKWFMPRITVSKEQLVIVLDDDESIHQVWQDRFLEAGLAENSIEHFKTPEGIIAWFKDHGPTIRQNYICLCDYEFLGIEKTGLDVIDELKISKNAILITSHFEEIAVQKKCEGLGVKLIPKNLAGYVPINIQPTALSQQSAQGLRSATTNTETGTILRPYCILLDDDEMVRLTWETIAQQKNLSIMTFAHPKQFYDIIDTIDRATPLYVDSCIGDAIKGEEIAKDFRERGFSHIYLATGFKKDDFGEMPWITDVVGKTPPYLGL